MSTEPLISVIIPVYNKEKYLRECIDSFTGQSYRNREIILVDDGSTDQSGKICDDYSEKHDCVKVIHKENGGPSSAWKAGFKIAEGGYVMFADSDDYVDTSMLEEMAECIKGIPREMVLCDHAITRPDGSEIQVYQELAPGEYYREAIEKDIFPKLLGNERRTISFSRCLKILERSLIADNIDYCDDRVLMGDDSTIILPAIFDTERIYMMDHKAFYHYRYLVDSIVHRYNPDAYDNNRLHYDALKNVIEKKFADDQNLMKEMINGLNKEELLLLLLIVKSEVRGNPEGCYARLKQLRNDAFVSDIVRNTKVRIDDKANKLVYMVLKNPSAMNIGLLKTAFKIYYRKNPVA